MADKDFDPRRNLPLQEALRDIASSYVSVRAVRRETKGDIKRIDKRLRQVDKTAGTLADLAETSPGPASALSDAGNIVHVAVRVREELQELQARRTVLVAGRHEALVDAREQSAPFRLNAVDRLRAAVEVVKSLQFNDDERKHVVNRLANLKGVAEGLLIQRESRDTTFSPELNHAEALDNQILIDAVMGYRGPFKKELVLWLRDEFDVPGAGVKEQLEAVFSNQEVFTNALVQSV